MKVGFDEKIEGLKVRTDYDPEIITKLRYIKENLRYSEVYAHYRFPWVTNETHQLSCVFHASQRDARGVPYERNPSARFYGHDKQIWCFACADGGDVSWFIKKKENHLHYGETLIYVAQVFGISLNPTDLAKRIELHNKQLTQEESPRRKILSEMYEGKVNDEFYKLRKLGKFAHPIADRLEPEIFKQKGEVDMFEGDYTSYAKQLRRWHSWTCELIEKALKHAARNP